MFSIIVSVTYGLTSRKPGVPLITICVGPREDEHSYIKCSIDTSPLLLKKNTRDNAYCTSRKKHFRYFSRYFYTKLILIWTCGLRKVRNYHNVFRELDLRYSRIYYKNIKVNHFFVPHTVKNYYLTFYTWGFTQNIENCILYTNFKIRRWNWSTQMSTCNHYSYFE